jgi:LmbE family N-acetylglucosaminyl deacetylase
VRLGKGLCKLDPLIGAPFGARFEVAGDVMRRMLPEHVLQAAQEDESLAAAEVRGCTKRHMLGFAAAPPVFTGFTGALRHLTRRRRRCRVTRRRAATTATSWTTAKGIKTWTTATSSA